MTPALSAAIALVLPTTLAAPRTAIEPPKNRYTPEDDVNLGREAGADVRKQSLVIESREILRSIPLTAQR